MKYDLQRENERGEENPSSPRLEEWWGGPVCASQMPSVGFILEEAGRAKTPRDLKALRMSVLLSIPKIPKQQPFATATSSLSARGLVI